MKKLTSKLLLSLIAVAIAIVALGTSTYAWFTLSGTTSTGAFNATVQSASGIQISLDNSKYANSITTAEMNQLLYNRVSGNIAADGTTVSGKTPDISLTKSLTDTAFKFEDITTTDGIKFSNLASGTLSSTTSGYLEFTIFFRSPNQNAQIKVSTSTSITGSSSTWTPSVAVENGDDDLVIGTAKTFDPSNATKISFAATTTATSALYLYGKEGTNAHGACTSEAGLARAYADAMHYTIPASTGTNTCPTYKTTFDDTTICTCSTSSTNDYYYGSVVVRIWIDGWDGDCIDAIVADTITAAFTFEMK